MRSRLQSVADGHIEGLGARATFSAHTADGEKKDFVIDECHGRVDHAVAMGARVVAVGHRVVHGGADLSRPLIVGDAELDILCRFTRLATLLRGGGAALWLPRPIL